VLIATQQIDDAWLERFRRITALDLQFLPPEGPDANVSQALLASDGIAVSELNDDEMQIFVRVDDVSGDVPMVAVVRAPRPLVGAARVVLGAVTLVLVALGLVAAASTLLLLNFGVVRRLRRLARASDGLEHGDLVELDGGARDEIGVFAEDFVAMGRAVLEREQSIIAATAKKKLVLDNAGSALLTIDTVGHFVGDVSAAAQAWFGTPAPRDFVWDYLAHGDEALQRELRRDFQAVGRRSSDVPLRRELGDRVVDCRWSSVRAGKAGAIVLLVMHDVTELVAQRRREEEEREEQRRWSEKTRNAYSERGDRRVSAKEYSALLAQLNAAGASEATLRGVEAWTRAPLAPIAQGLVDMASTVARKLGKELQVEVRGSAERIDRERTAPLWASLVHVVRNAVDHGIESHEEREACGKPRAGSLGVTAAVEAGMLVVTVSDDGRGIDWARVGEKAAQRGLPHETHAELTDALFADGLSTRDVASAISGRGIGLAALREAVLALGGDIAVSSVRGEGTLFRISVPDNAAARDVSARAPASAKL
jgi:HAMP domain-containing protein